MRPGRKPSAQPPPSWGGRVDLKNEKQADKLLDKIEERISDYARLEELADGSLFSAGYEEAKDA